MDALFVKHLLATSPAGPALQSLRRLLRVPFDSARHPELALLRLEDLCVERALRRMLSWTDNCIDVGGHIGSFAYQLTKIAGGGRLDIVEALPNKAGWLRKRFPNAHVHEVAISTTPGEISFFENLDQPGFSSITARGSRGSLRETRLPTKTLDEIVPEDMPVGFIKIDVEGHELDVVRSGLDTIRRASPKILFEAGARGDSEIPDQWADDLYTLLTDELGYAVFAAFEVGHRKPPLTLEEFRRYRTFPFLGFNYFALPAKASGDAAP